MRLALLFVILLLSTSAKAEPDKNIQVLINTPVSIFSYGMDKIDKKMWGTTKFLFSQFEDFISSPSPIIDFNWDKNQIILGYRMWVEKNYKEKLDKICRYSVEYLRSQMGVYNFKTDPLNWARVYFSTTGYSNKKIENAIKNIPKLVILKGIILTQKGGTLMECEGSLVSKRILYSKP